MASPIVLTANEAAFDEQRPHRLSPDAALVIMADGNACVVDMADKFYGLPAVGAQMLKLTLELGEDAAAARVAADFRADPAQVRADLRRFLGDLETRGILDKPGQRRRRGLRYIGARMFAAVLALRFKLTASLQRRAKSALTASRISLVLFGWPATLAAWRRSLRAAPVAPAERKDAIVAAIDEAVRAAGTRHWLGIDCKERGLSCWALARVAGVSAALNIGVKPYPVAGHCWCTVGETIVGDNPGYAANFTPALRYE